MFRLMIVDDEPIAVDSLHIVLTERMRSEFEVYRAYSAEQALETTFSVKMDILLCDIQMPQMNGFQLVEHVLARWPHCKIIFLTGYRDFTYVQTAIRNGSIDYVLKTEGDEAIFMAIEKAKNKIIQERQDDQLSHKAKEKLHLALPVLRREYLLSLLHGEADPKTNRKRQFADLEIHLDPEQQVLLVFGMVDRWEESATSTDKSLYLYCIQNIAEEYLTARHRFTSVQLDDSRFLWLLQPKELPDQTEENVIKVWQDLFQVVHGTLESVQATSKELLKLQVSLALQRQPCSWGNLAQGFASLKRLLGSRLDQTGEVLLTDAENHQAPDPIGSWQLKVEELRLKLRKTELLSYYLENRQKQEFFLLLQELLFIPPLILGSSRYKYIAMEMYYSLSAFFLSCLNKYGLIEEYEAAMGLNKLMNLEINAVWTAAAEFFGKTAEFLFDSLEKRRTLRTHEVIQQIHRYIAEHLADDLSLTRLAGHVYLNASYLSRLYKQETGIGLLEYITEMRVAKAKELLLGTHMKIHEISAAVGLISPTYFARIFKKATLLTPQEYRDARS